MTFHWLALATAILVSVGGQVLLKSGAGGEGGILAQFFRPTSIAGLALYGGSALLYMFALRKIPMSVALPCTAASYVAALVIGHFLFNEPVTAQKLAALGLICGGVVLLATA